MLCHGDCLIPGYIRYILELHGISIVLLFAAKAASKDGLPDPSASTQLEKEQVINVSEEVSYQWIAELVKNLLLKNYK